VSFCERDNEHPVPLKVDVMLGLTVSLSKKVSTIIIYLILKVKNGHKFSSLQVFVI
jgi:hypothetical protein